MKSDLYCICLYRDVKPANVLLAGDDTPVLMDFGSMAAARVEVKGSTQARQLMVRHLVLCYDKLTD